MMAFGDFYGVKLPQELTDDPLEDQPYVDFFSATSRDQGPIPWIGILTRQK